MARDMYGPMTGASAWMMTREWDARHVFLLWAMWAVMMAGMMLPSAAPLLLLYGAAVLLLAGVYQMTPLKSVCLRQCQSPMSFFMHHWRPGVRGAFRMGIDHGAYCLGCCWALMVLLFVGGVMNLAVIAALTVFVGFEKLGPFGVHTARASGALLIGAGVWMLLAPRL